MAGLRIVARTASAQTLLYISALNTGSEGAEWIRQAMNTALQQLPYVSETLGLIEVLPPAKTTIWLSSIPAATLKTLRPIPLRNF